MPQVFHRSFNSIARVSLAAAVVLVVALCFGAWGLYHSSYATAAGVTYEQPVPFSHEHHVGMFGIDCRYCHGSVEESSFAGIPPTKTCINCHSQIWVGSSMLAPVRESYRTNTPLVWNRVYNLPGFVYFDHSIHVQKGIGCSSCHGQIDKMPFTFQAHSLLMEWCLDCHRHPEQEIRPREAVFNMKYRPPPDQLALGRQLVKDYKIHDATFLTSCTVCHR